VNGFRGETKTLDQMKKRVEYDLWYMENWSMWLDIKIMFLTVFNTIKGEENAF
jgi:putative colanic acid biosynthesis UDP-glucose lipid carrier transferase